MIRDGTLDGSFGRTTPRPSTFGKGALTVSRTRIQSIATVKPELDSGIGPLGRIGLIVLSSDDVAEDAFKSILPDGEVACFTGRIPFPDAGTPDALLEMGAHLSRTAATILPENRIDLFAYSCTSGTAAMGEDRVTALLQDVRPAVPCTNPLTATAAAFGSLRARRVAVLTPYPKAIHEQVLEQLRGRAFEVVSSSSFDLHRDSEIGRVTPTSIHRAVRGQDLLGADAVFISCTLLRALEIIDPLEAEIGIPVVTSTQAMAWHALRLLGYNHPIDGFGQLLRCG